MKLLFSLFKFQEPSKEGNTNLGLCLTVIFLGFFILILFYPLKLWLYDLNLFERYSHPRSELVSGNRNDKIRLLILFTSSVITGPLIEELSFRYYITKSRLKQLIGIGFMITILCILTLEAFSVIKLSEVVYQISFCLTGLILGLFFYKFSKIDLTSISPRKLAITSAILFSLAHINVIGKQPSIVAYLIILIPYFIDGYMYSYLRVFCGFFYGFLAHAGTNFIIFLIDISR